MECHDLWSPLLEKLEGQRSFQLGWLLFDTKSGGYFDASRLGIPGGGPGFTMAHALHQAKSSHGSDLQADVNLQMRRLLISRHVRVGSNISFASSEELHADD